MIRILAPVLCALAAAGPAGAEDNSRSRINALIATHAQANNLPESLVHRVVLRESRYNPSAVGRGGTMGLMQIKHATARGLGYTGTADGLLDPDTNLTYGVKYLAGAYRAAGGNAEQAWAYYRTGYYHQAKQQRTRAGYRTVASSEGGATRTRRTGPSPWQRLKTILNARP